jgi:hypothetical protein
MRELREISQSDLLWSRPKLFSRRYELRFGEEVAATLEFGGCFTSQASAFIDGATYGLHRTGILSKRITLTGPPQESILGVLEQRWAGGGTLRLASGSEYEWAKGNFWSTTWRFSRESEPAVIEFSAIGPLTSATRVRIAPTPSWNPDLPLLAIIGWYALLMKRQDDAAGVVAGAGAAS